MKCPQCEKGKKFRESLKKQEVRTNKQFYEDHIDNLSTYKQI